MDLKGGNLKTVFILGCGATRGALSHVIIGRKRVKPPLNADLSMKAEHLSRCGFTNTEIAALLGSTPNSINVAIHKARHPKAKKLKKAKSGK